MLKELISKIFMGYSSNKQAYQIQPASATAPDDYESISFREGICLTNLPICIFSQGQRSFTFLLDTGSDNSIIDSNILGEMNYRMLEEKGSVRGLDAIEHQTDVCELALDYKNSAYSSTYLVKDMKAPFESIKKETGVTLHGILGSNFFRMFRFVIDFDSLVAYSKMTLQKRHD